MNKVTITIHVTSEEALLIADCLETGNDPEGMDQSLTVDQLMNAMRVSVTNPDGVGSVYTSNAVKGVS